MMPLLHHVRDGVVIVPPDRIRRGDIVLFDRQNGRYALHRVVGKGNSCFSMAGDNQYNIEKNLSFDQIIGVASEIERNGKRISCDSMGIRLYSWWIIIVSWPKSLMYKAYAWIKRAFKRSNAESNKEAQQ